MGEVASIHGGLVRKKGEPNPALVDMLRDVLGMAERGELQSFIGTGFVEGGERLAVWGDFHLNIYEMLGTLDWLRHEYVNRHVGGEA